MRYLIIFLFLVAISGCQKLEEVAPVERETFVKFFAGSGDFKAAKILKNEDGYIITGNIEVGKLTTAFIKQLDHNGNTTWSNEIENTAIYDIAFTDDGFIAVGDSIEIEDENETKTDIYLLKLDAQGNANQSTTIDGGLNDAHGSALVINGDDVAILGEIEQLDGTQKAVLATYDLATLTQIWARDDYLLAGRSYFNANTLLLNSLNNYIWTTSSVIEDDDNFDSFISIPVVEEDGIFVNDDHYGDILPDNYAANDIARVPGGYGIIGTKTNVDNVNGSLVYVKTNERGSIDFNNVFEFENISNQDQGVSLTALSEGGLLLLSTIGTTTSIGNGGKDFLVTKLDAFGTILWQKNYGGSGDETSGKIIEATDGGYIIFGSMQLQGVGSAVLMKIDESGELKN